MNVLPGLDQHIHMTCAFQIFPRWDTRIQHRTVLVTLTMDILAAVLHANHTHAMKHLGDIFVATPMIIHIQNYVICVHLAISVVGQNLTCTDFLVLSALLIHITANILVFLTHHQFTEMAAPHMNHHIHPDICLVLLVHLEHTVFLIILDMMEYMKVE